MNMTNTLLVILAAAFLLLVVFLIPVLLQLWRVTKGMTLTLKTLNQNLPLIMKNAEEITTTVNLTTTTVRRRVEELSSVLNKIQWTLNLLVTVEEILKRGIHQSFSRKVRTSGAIVKGLKVFLHHLLSKRS